MILFPRLRAYLDRVAAENRVGELGMAAYRPGIDREEWKQSVRASIDLDPLRPLITQLLMALLDALLDALFAYLEKAFGGGTSLPNNGP